MGTPQELTDECGNVVWCNYEFAWGGRYTHFYKEQSLNGCAILEHELQPIRFQGQFYDVETGLHYNRFRYYDTDVGMFIQRDPIGLLGGVNVFAYAPNPIHWIDPFGLYDLDDEGHFVYGLFEKDAVDPYYIGITKNITAREIEHFNTGRLREGDYLKPLSEAMKHKQARGMEQYYINDVYKTKTSPIGQNLKEENLSAELRGNKINSFDPSRTDDRGKAFLKEYENLKNPCVKV